VRDALAYTGLMLDSVDRLLTGNVGFDGPL